MAGKSRKDHRRHRRLIRLRAVDVLDFVEWKRFTKDWCDLRLNDDALTSLQFTMMIDPKAGAVIEGTGGLRKMRFAPPSWNTGKSGATRICYVYFEEYAAVYLLRAYAKNEQDDLNDSEKQAIAKLIQQISRDLAKARPTR